MSLTTRGRDLHARTLAHRYLSALRAATQDFAPPDSDGWTTDYALGFVTGHVGLAMMLARSKHALAWFYKWPLPDEHALPLTLKFAPECLGIDSGRFAAAHELASRSWKTDDGYVPINLGAGTGSMILRGSLARWQADVPRTYFGVQIMELETDLRRLRAPTRLGRFTGYRSAALIYRYMVMRTLGHEAFGVSREDADRFALNGI